MMRYLLPAILAVLLLSACAVQPGDPYTAMGAAQAAIGATEQARSAQATSASIAMMAGESAAQAEIAKAQQDVVSTQAALSAQSTQIALQSTQYAMMATETARPAVATAEAMQYHATATQIVIDMRDAQAEKNWSTIGAVAISATRWILIIALGAVVSIRWLIPVIDAKMDAWKESKKIIPVREKSGQTTYFVMIPQLQRPVTLAEGALYTNAMIDRMRGPARMSQLLDSGYRPAAQEQSAQPRTSRKLDVSALMLDAMGVGDPESNVVPGHRDLEERGWGSQSWQRAVNTLKDAGLVYTVPNTGTYVSDDVGTLGNLASIIMKRQFGVTLPSPTVEYADIYASTPVNTGTDGTEYTQ